MLALTQNLVEIAELLAAEAPLSEILNRIQTRVMQIGGISNVLVIPVENGSVVDPAQAHPFGPASDDWHQEVLDASTSLALKDPGELLALGRHTETWCIGLKSETTINGVMILRTDEDCDWTQRHLTETLFPWVKLATLAIHHAHHQRIELATAKRAEKLAQLARAIKVTTPLLEFTRLVRSAVVESGLFDRAGVFLVSKDKQWLEGCWGTDRNGEEECLLNQRWPRPTATEDFLWSVASGAKEFLLFDDYAASRNLPSGHAMEGVRHHAILGLRVGGEVVGELCVDNLLTGRRITESDIRLVMPFLDQTAVAIGNARLIEALEDTHQALVRAERMEAMASTSSEIAHSLNNILTRVIGAAEILQEQPNQSPDVKIWTDRIVFAAEEAADTVRRLRSFSRPLNNTAEDAIDLGQLVRSALRVMAEHIERHAIEVVEEVGEGVCVKIRHDDGIETVCALILNACDAMPNGGQLRVVLSRTGTLAMLEINDSGSGIELELLPKVMEPFFTTRQAQGHLGLGLSNVWRCVERWQGMVQISSEVGTGTTVQLTIPLATPV